MILLCLQTLMIHIKKIFLPKKRVQYLRVRGLTKQFLKQEDLIYQGQFYEVNFKLRQPKKAGIYAFRINKQFRALAEIKNNNLYIFRIDNHDDKRRR